jgi:hypothetical protein
MIVAAIPEKRLYTEDEAGIYLGYPAVFERVKKCWLDSACRQSWYFQNAAL